MRSKTLFSDLTILKKDLTRFAPAWLSLCAYLLLWTSTIIGSGEKLGDYYEPIAPIFAPIFALLVFGYLCDPRECNMVHSLPLRRERLMAIHVCAACLMYLIPTGIFCIATRAYATQGALYRFLFLALEFLFLFSIGTLCMMFTGRKIGAALLYIFIQCLSVITGVILQNLYVPLLPGVYLSSDWMALSPMLLISSFASFLTESQLSGSELRFILVFFLVSLAILAVCMLLYRKRKLEHAGDLLAVSWLDPFFAVCSGVTGAAAMVFFGFDSSWLQLLLGTAIGYLSYWMLSKKSARVFTPKILLGYVCLIAVLLGSMYLTYLDPLGRVYYVPEPHQVARATLGQSEYDSEPFETDDPSVIADLTALHLQLAEHYTSEPNDDASAGYDPSTLHRSIHITYELGNGRTIRREYLCNDPALLERAAWYLSQPEALFGRKDPSFDSITVRYKEKVCYLDPRLLPELTGVLLTECQEGRMFQFNGSSTYWRLTFEQQNPEVYSYIYIPESAVDTLAWLEAHCITE